MTSDRLPRFEAMTVGMILDHAVRLYARNFPLLIGIVSVAYVPYYALIIVILLALRAGPENLGLAAIVGGIVFFLGVLVWLIVLLPLSTGATLYAVGEKYLRREITVLDAYRTALKRFIHLLMAQFVVGMAVMVGTIFCLVPGIFLFLCLSLVTPVIMLERMNGVDSLKRSWELTEGFRLKILAVVAILFAFILVFSLGITLFLLFTIDQQSATGQIGQQLASMTVNILTGPLQSVALIYLYYDIRIRKESFDLEMLSRSLHPRESGVSAPGSTVG